MNFPPYILDFKFFELFKKHDLKKVKDILSQLQLQGFMKYVEKDNSCKYFVFTFRDKSHFETFLSEINNYVDYTKLTVYAYPQCAEDEEVIL
ncbi:MAG: hypothetical protein RLZZ156_2429 [Deinococcota bacterium]|jgi:hypothetical protein